MISLRVRLALILVAAIVLVVVIAVFVTVKIVDGPRDGSLERSAFEKVRIVARLLDGSPDRARAIGLTLGPPPAPERIDRDFLRDFRKKVPLPPDQPETLILEDQGSTRRIAFRLAGDEWVTMLYPSRPPSPLKALLAYLSLVVAGTTAIALLAAERILGPMRMLEGALQSIRPDGTLGPVPERGPAEVKATARALNALSGRLKTAMESRMRLIAAAGHDLRTPMTRLRLRAEFLPEEEREIWLRDLEELDRIADSAIRLVREEADETALEERSLGAIAADVVAELREIGLPAALGDAADAQAPVQPLAIKRALRNLVENAARHGGGAVMRVSEEEGHVLVLIEDDGPGIPDALLGRVFEPFFRVDAARRKSHPGAGLGLAIAREIVERHGGTLSLRNRPGGGLAQEMRLPRSQR